MKKRKWIILSIIAVFAFIGISMIYLQSKRRENVLQGSFTINQQEYVMGEGKGISLNLPDYTDEAETEEGTWRGKQYEDMETMEQELGIKLLKVSLPFKVISREEGKNYCLQVLDEERAMIYYFLSELPESKVNMPDMINVQFALAGGSKVGDIAFEDEVFEDKWKSEGGDEEIIITNLHYNLIDKYVSDKLKTSIFLVKSTSNTNWKIIGGDDGANVREQYFVQFMYQGIMYQLQWHDEIQKDDICEFVEMLEL